MPVYRLVLPAEFLRERCKDAIILLRIAAGANALEATLRSLLSLGDKDDSPAAKLGRVHAVCAAVAYLREIVKTIEKEKYEDRLWALVQLALDAGVELGKPLDEIKPLLSPKHPEIGGNVLLKVRDKIGFHWDPQPFRTFLDDPDTKEVTILESSSERHIDRIFRGSADAMAGFFFGLSNEGKVMQDLLPAVVEAHGFTGKVIEAAFLGLIIEAGEDPADYSREDSSDEA